MLTDNKNASSNENLNADSSHKTSTEPTNSSANTNTATGNLTNANSLVDTKSFPKVDLLHNQWVIIPILSLIAGLVLFAFGHWIIKNWNKAKPERTPFRKHFRITHKPKTTFHYIVGTFYRHSIEYTLFVALPLLLA